MHCGAFMWYEERSGKKKQITPPKFTNCCTNGKVQVPNLTEPPELLKELILGTNARSKKFIQNIRAYNMMFSFTSMSGKQDTSINRGGGPYVYKIKGGNYHKIGSLLPENGEEPKFAQLYIYDIENEIQNRISAIKLVYYFFANLYELIIHELITKYNFIHYILIVERRMIQLER